MSEVSIISLKEILNIEMGQSPSSDFVNDLGEGIPLLNGPAEFTSRFPIPKQYTTKGNRFSKEFDILFCVRGSTTGRMNYSDRKYAIGRGLAAISHKSGIEYNSFAKALLDHNLKGIIGGSMGSVFPNLTKDQLLDYKCTIPNLSTQKLVSKIFSDLDAKIELNNKINAELEAMAKLIYDYWFVQYEFPNEDGKPYKSSGGKMVWNEELKREIPEGWEVKELGKYAKIKKGTLITGKTSNSDGIIKVVSAGLDFSYYHDIANYPENTITISASGASAGYINFWREPIFACDCTTVRGESDADTIHILGFLKMRQDFIYQQARGSAQPHVYPKDIEVLLLPTPPIDLMEKFGKRVLSGNSKISNNLKENQKLAELRDWLLPMLMNGQVKVESNLNREN